jgi:KipI family sensor histidine kinase inhibitor
MTPGPARGTRRGIRPVGDRALLVECADLDDVLALHADLRAEPVPGQTDLLAAASTVLVVVDHPESLGAAAAALTVREVAADERPPGREVVVDTVYDGADLEAVAALTGLSPEGVVEAHTGRPWTAAFGGFAPGFVYLAGGDRRLDAPRLDSPRTAVPAGSVAVGGPFSAVYPRRSPGGWRLIGRTSAVLWDLDREPPALVRPGDTVRFRAVRDVALLAAPSAGGDGALSGTSAAGSTTPVDAAASTAPADRPLPALVVVAAGLQSLVQDVGRPGLLDLGVSASGALDRGAARRANRLVGNPRGAAVVETLLGGLQVRAVTDVVVAVTGAAGPVTRSRGAGAVETPRDAPFRLAAGEELLVGAPERGALTYLAVRGGIDVPAVLGSRSTDLLSGLGPAPLVRGQTLRVGAPPGEAVAGVPEVPDLEAGPQTGPATVDVVPGPRADWFTADALEVLGGQVWSVGDDSNRVGLRLEGTPLRRTTSAELPSEGVVAGSIQVPSSGRPVVLLADHPVSGGYPVVGVVRDVHLDRLAQLRPGDGLRFRVGAAPGLSSW